MARVFRGTLNEQTGEIPTTDADGSHEHDYTELRSESIADATRRLQSIDAGWKERDDPLGELVALRKSEG